MNRALSRNRLRHQAEPCRRSRRTGRHRVHPLFLEPLEDRTLLSDASWSTVGPQPGGAPAFQNDQAWVVIANEYSIPSPRDPSSGVGPTQDIVLVHIPKP